MNNEITTRSVVDKYEETRRFQLGLIEVLAYHCYRCWYTWLPKDVEIYNRDTLANRKPPKCCARCKSKLWREIPSRSTRVEPMCASIARIRMFLRKNRPDYALNLLLQSRPDVTKRILKKLKEELKPEDYIRFERAVLFELPPKQDQELETFKPL